MKIYRIHLIIIALCIILAHSLAYQDELDSECFTDSCVGCLDNCN